MSWADAMSATRMVVGLGNPGRWYAGTRHNIGFRVIDSLAEHVAVKVSRRRFGARLGRGSLGDKKLILLKPWKYMNRSGEPVAKALGYYELEASDLLVVVDDMALETGRLRMRARGSSGGHNGLADVIEKLGTSEFCRLRVGIGQSEDLEAVDFVLSPERAEEKALLDSGIGRARDAVLCWIEHGVDTAMNRFN